MRGLLIALVLAGALLHGSEASAEDFKRINPEGLYKSPYYSHVVIAPPGKPVSIAGQIAFDAEGNLVGKDDKAAQMRYAFKNLRKAIEAAGLKPEHVVKIQSYIVDYSEADLQVLGEETTALWGDKMPASTLVPVPRLARDGLLFEIDADAVLPD